MLIRIFSAVLVLSGALPTLALAQASPEQVVEAHFKAIAAQDYDGADGFFSRAFRDAFRESERLHEYYIVRGIQLEGGHKYIESAPLADSGKQTAVVVVEFGDTSTNPVLITERMYYYLIFEDARGYGVKDGKAWRIDIFDALRYDTLAAARRRPYLYTSQAWPEDTGRELRSRQGLFRLQWALSAYQEINGAYPGALSGGEDKSDPLLAGGFVLERYAANGFNDKPMRHRELAERSPGDFAYYAVDADGDGAAEGYYLLLHGADASGFYFVEHDIVHILSSFEGSQQELAYAFAAWWKGRGGAPVTVTTAVQPVTPQARLGASGLQPTAVLSETEIRVPTKADPQTAQRSRQQTWATASALLAGYSIRRGVAEFRPRTLALPTDLPPLRVFSYGL